MRWRNLLAVFGLSVTCVASFAERPPGDQRLATTRSASRGNGFFATTGMVRFQMIQGRLCLDVSMHRKGSQQRDEDGQFENITVTADRGIPSLHYIYKSNQQHVTASVHQARSFRVESWLIDSGERSILVQPAEGPIVFSVRRGDVHDQFTGTTLVHVRYADKASFDRHYGELVLQILRGRSLQDISDRAQEIVFDQINVNTAPTLQDVTDHVAKLRSKQRAVRVSAERQLLTWGTPIIPALQSIDQQDLDAQQKAKLQSIVKQLRPRAVDTPASLAKLFSNDRSYWAAIAPRLDSGQVQLASEHLRRIGFEPNGLENEPVERIAATPE